jgi:hypothetical protein
MMSSKSNQPRYTQKERGTKQADTPEETCEYVAEIHVPRGACSGDVIELNGPNGAQPVFAKIPPGVCVGDTLKVIAHGNGIILQAAGSIEGSIEEDWSQEEDNTLAFHVYSGSCHWPTVARHLPGRTTRQVKERWNSGACKFTEKPPRPHISPRIRHEPLLPTSPVYVPGIPMFVTLGGINTVQFSESDTPVYSDANWNPPAIEMGKCHQQPWCYSDSASSPQRKYDAQQVEGFAHQKAEYQERYEVLRLL